MALIGFTFTPSRCSVDYTSYGIDVEEATKSVPLQTVYTYIQRTWEYVTPYKQSIVPFMVWLTLLYSPGNNTNIEFV